MKKRWGALMFAAGVALGCLIGGYGGTRNGFSGTREERAVRMRVKKADQAVITAHESKWRTFGESVLEMDDHEREAAVGKLGAADRVAAMESLLAQAGPDGLDSDLRAMIKDILIGWGEENFDGAWDWARYCKPEALQVFAVKELLEDLAKRDPEKALKLYYEVIAVSPKYESEVPEILVKASAGKGADEFIELLGRFQFSSGELSSMGSPRGTSVDFAPDFDFRRAADATIRLMKEHEGKNPDRFPFNFINAWGGKDLAAADGWVMKNPELPFNDWSGLYRAAQVTLGAKAAGEWMAAKLATAGDRKGQMMEMLVSFSSADDIRAVAATLPEVGTRDQFLEGLIAASGGNYSEDSTSAVLEMMSSPAARLAALGKMPSSNGWKPDDDELEKLGISRARFDEISPPPPEEDR